MTFKDVAARFVVRSLVQGTGSYAERCQGSIPFKSGTAYCQVTDADGLSMFIRVSANYRHETVMFTRKELRRLGYGGRHGRFAVAAN